MNAAAPKSVSTPVSTTHAADALRAYRARMREIQTYVDPLRGQHHALEANIQAALQAEAEANTELAGLRKEYDRAVAAAPTGAHRDLEERLAAARANADRLSLRVSALRNAAQSKSEEIRAIEARAATEPQPELALVHAVVLERMTEAVESRNRIKARPRGRAGEGDGRSDHARAN